MSSNSNDSAFFGLFGTSVVVIFFIVMTIGTLDCLGHKTDVLKDACWKSCKKQHPEAITSHLSSDDNICYCGPDNKILKRDFSRLYQ